MTITTKAREGETELTFAGITQSRYVRYSPGACNTALEVIRAEIRKDSLITAVWDMGPDVRIQVVETLIIVDVSKTYKPGQALKLVKLYFMVRAWHHGRQLLSEPAEEVRVGK